MCVEEAMNKSEELRQTVSYVITPYAIQLHLDDYGYLLACYNQHKLLSLGDQGIRSYVQIAKDKVYLPYCVSYYHSSLQYTERDRTIKPWKIQE